MPLAAVRPSWKGVRPHSPVQSTSVRVHQVMRDAGFRILAFSVQRVKENAKPANRMPDNRGTATHFE